MSAPASRAASGWIDSEGRWRSSAPPDIAVLVVYALLLLVLLYFGRTSSSSIVPDSTLVLAAIIAIFWARYVSTRYVLDSDALHARRLFGSRSVRLDTVHRIAPANLRDLAPTGLWRGWGWHGRLWSPSIGTFESVSTISSGVLVYGEGVPLFVSPRDPEAFIRELSRRVRSYRGDVEVRAPAARGVAPVL